MHGVLQLNKKGILTLKCIFESSHPYVHVDACMLTHKHIQSPFHLTFNMYTLAVLIPYIDALVDVRKVSAVSQGS